MSLIPVFSPYVARYRFDQLDPTGEKYGLTASGFRSIAFNNDGTVLHYTDEADRNIKRLSLPTAWDLSSATTGLGPIIAADPVAATGAGFMMQFDPTGDTAFIGINEGGVDKVAQYTMSTPFGAPMGLQTRQAGPSTGSNTIEGAVITSDGGKLIVLVSEAFYSIDLTTPWNIFTSAAWTGVLLDLSAAHDNLAGFCFGEDETQLVVAEIFSGGGNRMFHEYTLSTAGDLSTATLTQSYDYLSGNSNLTSVTFADDGRKFFAGGSSDIVEYTAAS